MPFNARLASTVRSLFRKRALDGDLDRELEGLVEIRARELVEAGLPAERARREARLEIGGGEQLKELAREARRGAALDSLARDVRQAARFLGRNPVFAVVTILSLALGIGATTVVFSAIDAALIQGVPYAEADRLVVGEKTIRGRNARWVSKPDYFDFRELSRSFEQLAATTDFVMPQTVSGDAEPWVARSGFATWNLFRALRVPPSAGRDFVPEDEAGPGRPVVLLSHAAWRDRFGGLPEAVGGTITLDGRVYTIVGVMPAGLSFLNDADLWHVVGRSGGVDPVRDSHSHAVVGRLKPGVSLAEARQEVAAIARGLAERYPDTNRDKGLQLTTLQQYVVRDLQGILVLLMATTSCLLLIACANVAGLLLARGHRRLPELVMRSALGASRGRLVRQLLTESLLVTLAAGALGVVAAQWFVAWLTRAIAEQGVAVPAPSIDLAVLAFAVGLSILTGLVVGIVPAVRGAGVSPAAQLGRGKQVLEPAGSGRLRNALVVAQVAVAVVLLIGSGLVARSFMKLASVDLGFETDGVFTARIPIQAEAYPHPDARAAFYSSLLDEIRALPGVEAAGLVDKIPLRNRWTDWYVWRAGEPRPTGSDAFTAMARSVYPGYFAALRIPILRGRDIAPSDAFGRRAAIVLSERLAQRLFGDRDPIGRQVSVWNIDQPFDVVGVVGDIRLNVLTGSDPAMYMAAVQAGQTAMRLAVRTSGDAAELAGPIRALLRARDGSVPLADVATLSAIADGELGPQRMIALALGFFSAVALLLTGMGLYGTLAHHVSQQEREMGVRMALGASRGGLLRRVVGRGLLLAGVGVAAGLAAAVPATGLMRTLLYETTTYDVSAFSASVGVLAAVTAIACLLPAWRATRVNPVDVLRSE